MSLIMSWTLKFAYYAVLPPFLGVLGAVLILAPLGKSLGIRRMYVKWLLRVFEFATLVADEAKASSRLENEPTTSTKFAKHQSMQETTKSLKFLDTFKKSDSLFGDEKSAKINVNGRVVDRRAALQKYGKESRHNVISRRDNLLLTPDKPPHIQEEADCVDSKTVTESICSTTKLDNDSFSDTTRYFQLDVVFDYVKTGIASIIEDEVTQRFVAEELKIWNLLTRTSNSFEFVNLKLTFIWVAGFFVRYCVLLPGRLCILFIGLSFLLIMSALLSVLPGSNFKLWVYDWAALTCFRILSRSFSAVIKFHNEHLRPRSDGICVANHTTPIDVVILSCDRSYALIGQKHLGLFGLIQNALGKASSHIWFERSEIKDRLLVAKRLAEHVHDRTKLPILVFPEGTCINNTSVMQFKKGSFEVGGTIYPVAIKYDPIFGDAFWNSSKNGMFSYLLLMMTSWAIVCDVWYLPPMTRRDDENAIDFANRVKAEIARKGGLVDLVWDGNLKRMNVKSEWKAKQQEAFSKSLKVD